MGLGLTYGARFSTASYDEPTAETAGGVGQDPGEQHLDEFSLLVEDFADSLESPQEECRDLIKGTILTADERNLIKARIEESSLGESRKPSRAKESETCLKSCLKSEIRTRLNRWFSRLLEAHK